MIAQKRRRAQQSFVIWIEIWFEMWNVIIQIYIGVVRWAYPSRCSNCGSYLVFLGERFVWFCVFVWNGKNLHHSGNAHPLRVCISESENSLKGEVNLVIICRWLAIHMPLILTYGRLHGSIAACHVRIIFEHNERYFNKNGFCPKGGFRKFTLSFDDKFLPKYTFWSPFSCGWCWWWWRITYNFVSQHLKLNQYSCRAQH